MGYDLRMPGQWEMDSGPLETTPDQRREEALSLQRCYRRRYIRSGAPVPIFQLNDLVLIRYHVKREFEPTWVGPVRVITDARNNCYWVERGAYATREHINHLRPAPAGHESNGEISNLPQRAENQTKTRSILLTKAKMMHHPSTWVAWSPPRHRRKTSFGVTVDDTVANKLHDNVSTRDAHGTIVDSRGLGHQLPPTSARNRHGQHCLDTFVVIVVSLLLLLCYCLVIIVVDNKKVTTEAGVADYGRWESVTGHLFASVSLVSLVPTYRGGAGRKKSVVSLHLITCHIILYSFLFLKETCEKPYSKTQRPNRCGDLTAQDE
jgi:hypothetical protein